MSEAGPAGGVAGVGAAVRTARDRGRDPWARRLAHRIDGRRAGSAHRRGHRRMPRCRSGRCRVGRHTPEHRALLARDRRCQYLGCGRTRLLRAHHIWWVSAGGPTRLDNLVWLCPKHHRRGDRLTKFGRDVIVHHWTSAA